MRSITLALAAGVALGASSLVHAQLTQPGSNAAQQASAQPKPSDSNDAAPAIESDQEAQEALRLSSGASAASGVSASEGLTWESEGLFFRVDPVTGNTVLVD